ncbi:MAG: type II methionyl aminopeptidase [Nanoarchaeota archaeon]
MDKESYDSFVKAGHIAAEALAFGQKKVKIGASLREVCDAVEQKIKALGGEIAFPAQTSLNHVAAHNCPPPEDDTVYKEGDVVKLDIGAHINGYVADNACTINLGAYDDLVKASRDAVNAAIRILEPGLPVCKIGKVIEEAITSYGFEPIRNLCGHGLGKYRVHTSPTIPNYDNGDPTPLKEGQAIAIEPFASTGSGMIHESGQATVFMQINKKPIRSPIARNIQKEIEAYQGLPFTTRWLTQKFSLGNVKLALLELKKIGNIREYPPLPEKNGGMVSQAEHSIIIKDKPVVITKRDED